MENGRCFLHEGAFTLVEIMLAIFIFAGVIVAIYSSWSAIVRSTSTGQAAAAEAQRRRVSIYALEEALNGTLMFAQNAMHYSFEVETTKKNTTFLSFVARLPEGYPRNGRFEGDPVRRVTFTLENDRNTRKGILLLRQQPMLAETDRDEEDNPLVLARDVSLFQLEYLGSQSTEWQIEWPYTNQLPRVIRFALGVGGSSSSSLAGDDIVKRTIILPSAGVPAAMQAPGAGIPGGGTRPPQ